MLHLEPADGSFVAVGTLDAGRGPADIAAYLANPTEDEPEWFSAAAILVGEVSAATAVATLDPGLYTVACLEGTWGAMELRGTTTFPVTP